MKLHTGIITCLAANGTRGIIATGHERGEVLLWHDLPAWTKAAAEARLLGSAEPAPPVTTKLHWHAHPVAALGMSSSGDYLYSGVCCFFQLFLSHPTSHL